MKTIPTTVWNGKDLITVTKAQADYLGAFARIDRAAAWLGGMVVGEGAAARRRLVSL